MSRRNKQQIDLCPGSARGRRKLKRYKAREKQKMPFFTGSDKAFLATIPPSAKRYDWDRDRFCIKRGQRGYFAITHGVGEHGSRFPQCWRWKTWVDYKGHHYAVRITACRVADAAPGYKHLKYYDWCHAIRRNHPMYAVLQAMYDLDHFCAGHLPSIAAVRQTFLECIQAAVDGGEEGYREYINKKDRGRR